MIIIKSRETMLNWIELIVTHESTVITCDVDKRDANEMIDSLKDVIDDLEGLLDINE